MMRCLAALLCHHPLPRPCWPGLLVLAMLLLGAGPLRAQTPEADSLRRALQARYRPDTARVNTLNALALALRNNAPDESAALFRQAQQLARRRHYARGAAEGALGQGFYYRHRGEYGLAESYSKQARHGFAQAGDRLGQTRSLYNLACVYSDQGRYVQSLRTNLRGLALAEADHNRKWMAFLNTQLGITSTYLAEYGRAESYLRQGLRLARASGDLTSIGHAYAGLGDLYRKQGRWAEAARSYAQDEDIFRRLGFETGRVFEEINLGDVAERQAHYPVAFAYARSALRRAARLRVHGETPRAELVLARAHLHTGRPDSAVFYARRSLAATRRSGAREYSRDASQVLALATAQLGRFAEAYRYEQQFGAYRDSLNSADLRRRAAVLEYRADLARKRAEIRLLTKNSQLIAARNRQQRGLLLVTLLGLAAAGGLSLGLWRINRAKQHAFSLLEQQQAELRAAQAQLVQAEKWAFVGEVSAGIAHELQNPLAFMRNFADVSVALLDAEPGRPAGPATLEQEIMNGLRLNLQKISQQGQRASSIISDMLAHARRGNVPRQPTDLNALATEALALVAQGRNPADPAVAFVPDLAPALPLVPAVAADLTRVLVNLCANAVHAVGTRAAQAGPAYQPTVTVRTRQLTPEIIEIRVIDNGPGMAAGVRARVFEPFFTTKPAGEGTGLGLSLSHDIITKGHGGTLTVESTEGEGTEFIVTLPAAG
ncbi:ATP-binding protein [Hymenobacter sp. DH14]|uniref:histidine kinase n=1 Tax=Hymenobacter cyanobacteriorum TaxID=2926463 RepID=A0A9X2AJN3_9BACT|nr:ATP-binding protein [Hymenobacter cyanobacteriorum]MCI1189955.1 ATP-binding protein [Hymenobacter cyanobacteriorum]